jgi:hypothetical protein
VSPKVARFVDALWRRLDLAERKTLKQVKSPPTIAVEADAVTY